MLEGIWKNKDANCTVSTIVNWLSYSGGQFGTSPKELSNCAYPLTQKCQYKVYPKEIKEKGQRPVGPGCPPLEEDEYSRDRAGRRQGGSVQEEESLSPRAGLWREEEGGRDCWRALSRD